MNNKCLIEVNGVIETNVNHDEFYEKFIRFIENEGWSFGGITNELKEKEE